MAVTMTRSTLIDSLPAEVGGPDWLAAVRRGALEALRERGLPGKKTEAWRFTPVAPLLRERFADAAPAEVPAWAAARLPEAAAGETRVYLVNGHLVAPASAAGVTVMPLGQVMDRVKGVLGEIAAGEHFAALNAARFAGGAAVWLDATEAPLHIVHVSVPGAEPTVCYPRLVVTVGQGARATLIESYLAGDGAVQLTSAVTEIEVGPRAQLDHVRVHRGGDASSHVGTLAVRQQAGSVYRSLSASLGGAFARLDVNVLFAGEGAECELDGAYHTTGRELCDHHTVIDHAVPRCSSRETYRGVIDGSSHAIFDGTVYIRRDAQQSSVHQENRNLLLSDDATVNTKPHLEIDADDVVASHGATVGALDEDQLFYLRARGVDEVTARAALIYGFLHDAISRVGTEETAAWLGAALRDRLPDGHAIEEILV